MNLTDFMRRWTRLYLRYPNNIGHWNYLWWQKHDRYKSWLYWYNGGWIV